MDYLTQNYTIAWREGLAEGTETHTGTFLPMARAQAIADQCGAVCIIRHMGGHVYVYPR